MKRAIQDDDQSRRRARSRAQPKEDSDEAEPVRAQASGGRETDSSDEGAPQREVVTGDSSDPNKASSRTSSTSSTQERETSGQGADSQEDSGDTGDTGDTSNQDQDGSGSGSGSGSGEGVDSREDSGDAGDSSGSDPGPGGTFPNPTNFAERVMHVLENEVAPQAIWWVGSGEAIAIHPETTKNSGLLTSHFHANRFSTFVRTLVRWGFKKVSPSQYNLPDPVIVLRNSLFQKDKPHLVHHMMMDSDVQDIFDEHQRNIERQEQAGSGPAGQQHQQAQNESPSPPDAQSLQRQAEALLQGGRSQGSATQHSSSAAVAPTPNRGSDTTDPIGSSLNGLLFNAQQYLNVTPANDTELGSFRTLLQLLIVMAHGQLQSRQGQGQGQIPALPIDNSVQQFLNVQARQAQQQPQATQQAQQVQQQPQFQPPPPQAQMPQQVQIAPNVQQFLQMYAQQPQPQHPPPPIPPAISHQQQQQQQQQDPSAIPPEAMVNMLQHMTQYMGQYFQQHQQVQTLPAAAQNFAATMFVQSIQHMMQQLTPTPQQQQQQQPQPHPQPQQQPPPPPPGPSDGCSQS